MDVNIFRERDRYLIRIVAEHRVLTTEQLSALAFDNIVTARHRLGALAGLGALRHFRPHRASGSAPWHYLLGPFGAALLGAEDRDAGNMAAADARRTAGRAAALHIMRRRPTRG